MKSLTSSSSISLLRSLFPSLSPPYRKPSLRISIRSSSSAKMEGEQQQKRVIVCGGGVIGVCTAFFLAKKGAKVTLIEKSSIACAASGKAGGFLALDWCDGTPISKLARTSFNLHRTLALELNGSESYGYRPIGTLSLSITEQDPTSSSSGSKSILPSWVDGPVRNPNVTGTIETTAQVHPQLFTRALLSFAVANHELEVVIGELERVEIEQGRVRSVVLKEKRGGESGNDNRVIETDSVVLALGPWSSCLSMISSLFNISALKVHSIVLIPKDSSTITPHALSLTYKAAYGGKPIPMDHEVYPRPTGEVYVCGMSAMGEVPDDPEQIMGDPESIKVLKRIAGTVSSYLKEGEVEVRAEQACFLPLTDDDKPVIGEMPNVKGCYVATGHSCWGILNGPATGAAMAELVLDGVSSVVDLTPFSPARFLKSTRPKHKQ
ncbi:hypothetical protein MKW94_017102 [Papaver nudicaule]|uniref:FAD dependent oxidoreductase domain-containing protein n=1 Tax=Papaver nudicaule TaxID=74823 RepID=A0AA41W270_PAPNU|nr:hypothetical protein [Papaver nudicaule]MCL7051428.1 hypothetical protein [Papaver nudicaule]